MKKQKTTCTRCHRRLTKSTKSGMGERCERIVRTTLQDSDLFFGPQRFGAQYR